MFRVVFFFFSEGKWCCCRDILFASGLVLYFRFVFRIIVVLVLRVVSCRSFISILKLINFFIFVFLCKMTSFSRFVSKLF